MPRSAKPAAAADADTALEGKLSALKKNFETLRDARARAEATVAELERQLAELEARAVADYGTADPEALERLLAEKRAENERLVADYERHLRGIQAKLAGVEDTGGQPE